MHDSAFKILVIADDAVATAAVREALNQPGEPKSSMTWIPRLGDSVASLADAVYDAILLDLSLQDRPGIASFKSVFAVAGSTPILVLTDHDDEAVGQEALLRGAKECIPKKHIDKFWLRRHLRHIVERASVDSVFTAASWEAHDNGVFDVEPLIRWLHQERGLVPPDQFVPVAEDCGLIVPMGRWVLHEACRQARAWQKCGLPTLPVAVNVSALELRQNDFLASVRAILKETALDPSCLELELTESVLMQNVESTAAMLGALKSMGVLLAIDDFGSGYSSLTYLRQFPFDTLKIDQAFVRDITEDANDAAIVSAMINLGRSLQRRDIAEGVETPEQLAFLRAHLCDEGQGCYFGRPVGASQFAALLQRQTYSSVTSRHVAAGRRSS